MAVAFDAVGPSSSGAGGTTGSLTSPLTWTHTNNGNAIVVGCTSYTGSANTITGVTYGGVALTFLGFVQGGSGGAGGIALYGKVGGLPTGANTVSVAFTGGGNVNAGSISFTGAGSLGTAVTAASSGSAASVTCSVANTTTGGMIAAAASYGGTQLNTFSGTNSVTVRWQHPGTTNTGADNGVGGTVASTGGGASQTVGFSDTGSDYWGLAAVEVQPATSTPISSADTAKATEGSSIAGGTTPHGSDSAAASPGGSIHATLSGADSAHGAEKGATSHYLTSVVTDSTGGHFTDNTGKPILWVASETWNLLVRAGEWTTGTNSWQTEIDNYMVARAGQGVTVAMLDVLSGPTPTSQMFGANSNGTTWDGVTPFVSGGDPTTGLNSTFWTRVDYLMASAQRNGITVGFVFNAYDFQTGGAFASWTTTQCTAYGNAVGARYSSANQPNIVWLFGNDEFQGTHDTQYSAFLTGLRNNGANQIAGAWWSAEYTSRYEADNNAVCSFGVTNSAFNFCYTYNASYWIIDYAYTETSSPDNASALLPVIYGDGYFYQGTAGAGYASLDRDQRQEWWWALAEGARGIITESENVWEWNASSCPAAVTQNWSWNNTLPAITSYYASLPNWHKLVPDTASSFVTAGRGTRVTGFASGGNGGLYENSFTNAYVAASITADGSLAVLYMPHASTVTINTSKLQAGYSVHWVDPVNAATYPASGTTSFASGSADGSKGITNSQGDPDWALVFTGPVNAAISGADSAHAAEPAAGSFRLGVGRPITARGWVS